eukprot:3793684-Pleurochrysis_carterae.AAC.2
MCSNHDLTGSIPRDRLASIDLFLCGSVGAVDVGHEDVHIQEALSSLQVTSMSRVPLSVMSWGLLLSTERASLSTLHARVLPSWFSAIRTAHGFAAMKVPLAAIHSAYSNGARPNSMDHNASASQHHALFDLKVPS